MLIYHQGTGDNDRVAWLCREAEGMDSAPVMVFALRSTLLHHGVIDPSGQNAERRQVLHAHLFR